MDISESSDVFSKEVFEPLEKAIHCTFIPALTLQPAPNDQMRAILSLPASKGGLAIVDPQVLAMEQDHVSADRKSFERGHFLVLHPVLLKVAYFKSAN